MVGTPLSWVCKLGKLEKMWKIGESDDKDAGIAKDNEQFLVPASVFIREFLHNFGCRLDYKGLLYGNPWCLKFPWC